MRRIEITRVKAILILIFYLPFYAHCLDLTAEWIRVKSENIDPAFHLNPYDPSVSNYLRIKFTEGRKLDFLYSPYSIRPDLSVTYSLDGDILTFNTRRVKVAFRSDTLMVLEDLFSSNDVTYQPKRETFYEKGYLVSKYRLSVVDKGVIENDTLTLEWPRKLTRSNLPGLNRHENYQLFPVFSNADMTFVKLLYENLDPEIEISDFIFSKIAFDVMADGKVSNIRILEGDNEKFNGSLLKSLSSSANQWTAISYLGRTLSTTMIFPVRVKIKVRDPSLVKDGDKYYMKKDYKKAIEFYSRSLKLDSEDIDALYNRAAAFYQMGDKLNACKDWTRIYRLGRNESYDLIRENCR